MPMEYITVTAQGARRHADGADPSAGLRKALAQAGTGPIVIMIHGYKYQPGHAHHCPHNSILSMRSHMSDTRLVSWPRHLGIGCDLGDEGLGIGFGWFARGSIWAAHRRAKVAGEALAALLAQLRQMDPSRPIHLVAHSLGARVALRALAVSPRNTIQKAILLSAAEYAQTAKDALLSPGGQSCDVLNVTSRENDVFDFMLEALVSAPVRGDCMVGHGKLDLPNLATLQLDDPESLFALRRAGHSIAESTRTVCHWSSYIRTGVFPLYRAFLAGDITASEFKALLPDTTAPRWSRLAPSLPRALFPTGLRGGTA